MLLVFKELIKVIFCFRNNLLFESNNSLNAILFERWLNGFPMTSGHLCFIVVNLF